MSTDVAFRRNGFLRRLAPGACAAALFSALLAGCGYPVVSEPALRLAQAIDTVANLRDPAQIPKARETVEARFAEGKIAEGERDLLLGLLDQAEAGEWEAAEANARALLHAQNGGSRPLQAAGSCCDETATGASSAQNGG